MIRASRTFYAAALVRVRGEMPFTRTNGKFQKSENIPASNADSDMEGFYWKL
jgi:hypothetical protein